MGAAHRLGALRHLLPRRYAGAVLDARALPPLLDDLALRGYDHMVGLEVEFHVFRLDDARLAPDDRPAGEPPLVSPLTQATSC